MSSGRIAVTTTLLHYGYRPTLKSQVSLIVVRSQGVGLRHFAETLGLGRVAVTASTIINLDPELAAVLKDLQSVNDAPRSLIKAAGLGKTLLLTRKARRRVLLEMLQLTFIS